jgi:hypothetical protein
MSDAAEYDNVMLFGRPEDRDEGGSYVDDPGYEAWAANEYERGELAFAPDALHCPKCNAMKTVAKLGKVVDVADPTQSYVLECGHVTI